MKPRPMLALETNIAAWSIPPDPDAALHPPSHDYGRLDGDACERSLSHRRIPYTRVGATPGVDRPVRLTGPIHGVAFRTESSTKGPSPYEIIDCRLALALDDFAAILSRYGIVEVVYMSVYRPPPKKSSPRRKRSQHEAALAIDVGAFARGDGEKLVIEKDWHGAIGSKTCGEGAGPRVYTSEAMALRGILCSAADAHIFQLLLTPNHDQRHFNHFHLEVVRNATWFILK